MTPRESRLLALENRAYRLRLPDLDRRTRSLEEGLQSLWALLGSIDRPPTNPPILTPACSNAIPFTLNFTDVDLGRSGTLSYQGLNSAAWTVPRWSSTFTGMHVWAGALTLTMFAHNTCTSVVSDCLYVLYISSTSSFIGFGRMIETASSSPFCLVPWTWSGTLPNGWDGGFSCTWTCGPPFAASGSGVSSYQIYGDSLSHQVDFSA